MYVLHRWYGESIGFHFLIADLKTTKKRSSHPRCFIKKGVLKNFAKFTRKFLCPSLFYNKIAGLATLLKKRLWHSFPVNFAKFLRIPILENICERLLLKKSKFFISLRQAPMTVFRFSILVQDATLSNVLILPLTFPHLVFICFSSWQSIFTPRIV